MIRAAVPLLLLIVSIFGFQSNTVAAQTTPLTLAENGRSSYVIVLAADAIPAEQTAARELRDHLKTVTDVTLPIVKEVDAPAGSPQILVGQSSTVRELLPQQDWPKLGTGGIVVKTAGQNLILAGGRPRGSLYAVYQFLEDQVGCRWWTPTESTLPKRSILKVPALDLEYVPEIKIRDTFYSGVRQDPIFATRMRNNGHFQTQGPAWGGHSSILGFVHTFESLLPPAKYFKDHPDWYADADNGGKPSTTKSRIPGSHWQICVTNEAARQELTKNALEWIRRNPAAGVISISQNDNVAKCTCPNCAALEAEEGSPSGPVLHLVNAVAEDIEKEFPGFLVETLAYTYTRKPPKSVKPRHNVVIRLCSIEGDFSKPLDSEANAAFRRDVVGWRAISPQLYIWDYVANFGNCIYPHPNLRVLGPNLRFFAANKSVGVFEQGDAYTQGTGDFVQLRTWLLSRLLWNPHQDEDKLIDEFLTGYYGAAGPHLRQYLDLMEDSVAKWGQKLGMSQKDGEFLTLDVMNRATSLFAKASASVADDPTLSQRVRRARLPLDHAWILRYEVLRSEAKARNIGFDGPASLPQALDEFIAAGKQFGAVNASEIEPFSRYTARLRARFAALSAPLPAAVAADIPAGEKPFILDVQQDQFMIYREGQWCSVVNDPAASDGKAVRIVGNIIDWAVQYPLDVLKDMPPLKPGVPDSWHCYALARVDAKPGAPLTGGAYDIAIHNKTQKTTFGGMKQKLADANLNGYDLIDLGTHPLIPNSYLWIAPTNNPNVAAIYLDRIILVRQPN